MTQRRSLDSNTFRYSSRSRAQACRHHAPSHQEAAQQSVSDSLHSTIISQTLVRRRLGGGSTHGQGQDSDKAKGSSLPCRCSCSLTTCSNVSWSIKSVGVVLACCTSARFGYAAAACAFKSAFVLAQKCKWQAVHARAKA
jgi:hypothetical protein